MKKSVEKNHLSIDSCWEKNRLSEKQFHRRNVVTGICLPSRDFCHREIADIEKCWHENKNRFILEASVTKLHVRSLASWWRSMTNGIIENLIVTEFSVNFHQK